MPRKRIARPAPACSGRPAMPDVQTEFAAVTPEAPRAVPQPDQRALGNGDGPSRIFRNERAKHFAIPSLGMLDVEHCVDGEIVPRLCWHTETTQPSVYEAGAGRRRHFNCAERAD